jgi:dedicator of cytokinesis protein 1
MIAKLDILVEGGRGDEQYKELFGEIMLERCENHSTMREQVRSVVHSSRHQYSLIFAS